jgi:lipopolysaccharide biosynthesis glycosyltransferase
MLKILKIRLSPYEIDAYFNSGVLLMNLKLQRMSVDEKLIYEFVEKNHSKALEKRLQRKIPFIIQAL